MNTTRFPQRLRAIYDAVDELETMFPGRHFTPDGHLVGSPGEALAAHHYQLELLPASARCHDCICDGRSVQIKATQGNRIAISSQPDQTLNQAIKPSQAVEPYEAWILLVGLDMLSSSPAQLETKAAYK